MRWLRAVFALWCGAACSLGAAHENPSNHATIVQREAGHYVLTLQVDVAEAMRRTLQPAVPPAEFQAAHAAMAAPAFAAAWERATQDWARAGRLGHGAESVAASRWRWPPASQAQASVRERLMHALTAGAHTADSHAPPPVLRVEAEFRLAQPARDPPRLRLHPAWRPLSVTSYRPHSQWAGPGDGAITLGF